MKRRRAHTRREHATFDASAINREIDYIVRRALDADGRVVTIGPLILFSTETGDAWILDPSDGRGHRLCHDGSRASLAVIDLGDQVAIEWTGSYQIEGDAFAFVDSRGGVRTVLGYPTREICAAAARLAR
jgi:hypothetical protein